MPVNAMHGPGLVFSVKMPTPEHKLCYWTWSRASEAFAGRYPLDKKEPTMVCVGGRVDHLVESLESEAMFKLYGLAVGTVGLSLGLSGAGAL